MVKIIMLLAATLLLSLPAVAVMDDEPIDASTVKLLIDQQTIPSDGDRRVPENFKVDEPMFTEGAYRDHAHANQWPTAVTAKDIGTWNL